MFKFYAGHVFLDKAHHRSSPWAQRTATGYWHPQWFNPLQTQKSGIFLIVGTRCTNLLHGELMASSLVWARVHCIQKIGIFWSWRHVALTCNDIMFILYIGDCQTWKENIRLQTNPCIKWVLGDPVLIVLSRKVPHHSQRLHHRTLAAAVLRSSDKGPSTGPLA